MTQQDTPRPSEAGRLIFTAKYILIAALALFTAMTFAGSRSRRPFGEVAEQLEQAIDTQDMQKRRPQDLKRCYGLNPADCGGVLFYTADSYMSAEELLLIKAKNESQLREMKAAAEQRLENRKNDFKGYLPEQTAILEHAQIIVRGDYLFVAASKNADLYRTVFLKSL